MTKHNQMMLQYKKVQKRTKVGNVHENENMKLNCGDVKKVT